MTRVPYDYMVERVERLVELSALLYSTVIVNDILDELDDYLKGCGWNRFEFDDETLNRIDSNWESFVN